MKKIAVIGGGISGLFAADQLAEEHEVTLFEGTRLEDQGMHVIDPQASPRFIAWLKELDVAGALAPLDLSLGIETRDLGHAMDQGSKGLVLRRNYFNKKFWALQKELRAYRKDPSAPRSEFFMRNHLGPLATLRNFIPNFPLEGAGGPWLSLKDGASYRDAVLKRRSHRPFLEGSVTKLTVFEDHVLINGDMFDACVMAAPADRAAALMDDKRSELLSRFVYKKVRALWHTDRTQMPASRRGQATWNIVERGGEHIITYAASGEQFLTMAEDPKGTNIIREVAIRRLALTAETTRAQQSLHTLNRGPMAFAGDYFGSGLEEDAVRAAERALKYLTARFSKVDLRRGPPQAPAWLMDGAHV